MTEHGPEAVPAPDDRWGYRAKRDEFLRRFGTPGTPEGDAMRAALEEVTDALLREARYHATWPVATAEKWRYDRMLWTFGIMLGEIPADTPAPLAEPLELFTADGSPLLRLASTPAPGTAAAAGADVGTVSGAPTGTAP